MLQLEQTLKHSIRPYSWYPILTFALLEDKLWILISPALTKKNKIRIEQTKSYLV